MEQDRTRAVSHRPVAKRCVSKVVNEDSKGFKQGGGITRCTLFRPREATRGVGEVADWAGAIVRSSEIQPLGDPGGGQDIGLREPHQYK